MGANLVSGQQRQTVALTDKRMQWTADHNNSKEGLKDSNKQTNQAEMLKATKGPLKVAMFCNAEVLDGTNNVLMILLF